MCRQLLVVCALMLCTGGAHAQSGWEARVTAAPNPLPAGKCAAIVVEPVDDHGYRRTTLSTGAEIDRRKFTYATSDAAHFTLRNDPEMWGGVCADTSAPSVSTIVTVTLPDGLKGTVEIFALTKGAATPPAVVYRQQAPLRLPTSPEFAPGFVRAGVAARTSSANSGGAAGAAGASADPTEPNATTAGARVPAGGAPSSVVHSVVATPRPIAGTVQRLLNPSESVTTSPLSLVGTYHVVSAIQTTPALSLTGTYHVLSVVATTPALSLTGTYGSNPVAGTAPRAVNPKPIPPGAHSP